MSSGSEEKAMSGTGKKSGKPTNLPVVKALTAQVAGIKRYLKLKRM